MMNRTLEKKETTAIRDFLSFKLGVEEYGIDILRVQEIRSYEEPTRIANAPEFIKGVINLRGVIVPILDLRIKFGMTDVTYSSSTVVIFLSLKSKISGIIVDSVSDVITLKDDQIRDVPTFTGAINADHLFGLGAMDDRMLILLDIEGFMESSEMCLV